MVKTMIVQSSIWCSTGFSSGGHTTSVQGASGPGTQTGLAQDVGVILGRGGDG